MRAQSSRGLSSLGDLFIYDPEGNRKRATIDYQSFSFADGTSCNLPKDFYEYQANGTTLLRRTHFDYGDYIQNPVYTSRRIIGLLNERTLYEYDPCGSVVSGDTICLDMSTTKTSSAIVATRTSFAS